MSTAQSPAAKICIHCGQDCSAKPRTKDPQGRYACKSCFDRLSAAHAAQAGKPAPAAAARSASVPPVKVARPAATPAAASASDDADQDSFLASFADTLSASNCISCSAGLAAGSAFCTACGTDQATGRQINTRTLKAPKEKKARSARTGGGPNISPGWIGLALIGIFAALTIFSGGNPEMLLLVQGLVALLGLTAWITTIVCAFMDGRPGWGVVGILSFIPLVGLALLYYVFFINERAMVKMLIASNIICSIMVLIAAKSAVG
jgi:hypothetical protein